MADDDSPVAEAIDELYSIDPDEFMGRRSELAAAAKKAGDPATAKQITALRKPTRSAYTVNRLSREDPDAVSELFDLAAQLRDAERSVDAGQIRDLTRRRRRLLDELAKRAFAVIDEQNPSSALRDEVVSTLTAALADEDVAEQIDSGTLVRPAKWEGFSFGAGPDLRVIEGSRPTRQTKPVDRKPVSKSPRTAAGSAERKAAEEEAAAKARAKAEEERAAIERAQREALAEAEQTLQEADTALAEATGSHEKFQDHLRDLEEQVIDTRLQVDDAKVQVRRAEIAQRRARDALRRLQR